MIKHGAKPQISPSHVLTFDKLLTDLYDAYHEACQHKRYTANEVEFEVCHDYLLRALANRIWKMRYRPTGGVAFLSFSPTVREIFGASFIDRVVHHYLFDKIYEFIDLRLDPDSYSCRPGKGTDYGVKRLQRHVNLMRRDTDEEVYVVKFDLSGYFMSLPRQRLYETIVMWLDWQYPEGVVNGHTKRSDEYYIVKHLWKEIIMDSPIEKAHVRGCKALWVNLPWSKSLYMQQPGVGIVIGNLSSQLLSNLYLDQLDRYMRFMLDYRHYGRYVDDFYVVVKKSELARVEDDKVRIKKYLRSLGLNLNLRKTKVYRASQGVPFLGAVVYPQHVQMGSRLRKNHFTALVRYTHKPSEKTRASLTSYRGFAMHCSSKNLMEKMWRKVDGGEANWPPLAM